jgi:transposase
MVRPAYHTHCAARWVGVRTYIRLALASVGRARFAGHPHRCTARESGSVYADHNKSDRNNAAGIARIMQTGWYRQVQVKSPHIALPLLETREALHHQLALLERRVRQLAKEHKQTSRFMTVPGVVR